MKRASPPQDQEVLNALKDLESQKAAYPPELLAARRAAFLDQIAKHTETTPEEKFSLRDQKIIQLLKNLKAVEGKYPAYLWSVRRAAYRKQIAQLNQPTLLQNLRSAFQNGAAALAKTSWVRQSFVLAFLAIAAYIGFISNSDRGQVAKPEPLQTGVRQVKTTSGSSAQEAKIICKPGFDPPHCLAKEFAKEQDLTYPGNGLARPAVAKDTIPGYDKIHRAAYVNDGLYGPGASWISNSPNSWIKIDLGTTTKINTVTFGRDRLGQLNDRDPGQFVIALALSDDVYADGNSSNDEREYVPVFISKLVGFDGTVAGAETVTAQFNERKARYIKITFENQGVAIDEVEVFFRQPYVIASNPTKAKKENLPGRTSTPLPTITPLPTFTATLLPTNTPLPTDTATPVPTDTPIPTDTATPLPTDTPMPTDTATPLPTDTPMPTNTPLPEDLTPTLDPMEAEPYPYPVLLDEPADLYLLDILGDQFVPLSTPTIIPADRVDPYSNVE
jgi:hypothetical protein